MIEKTVFGHLPSGEQVDLYTITNSRGASVSLQTLGAGIVRLYMPDRNGNLGDVVLGFDDPALYTDPDLGYQGLVVGRWANRIRGAAFDFQGQTYHTPMNQGQWTLHSGGRMSFHLWQVKDTAENSITFSRFSPDMEDGFPGNLKLAVRYTLTEDNAFRMDYRVSSDADTIVNLTNHSYFNLNGEGDILGQKLRIYASNYLEGNNQTCPTGAILPVANTPMDFTEGKLIGRDIDTGFAQTTMVGGGYDHCFVIDRARGSSQSICAWVTSEKTGISMKLYTTQPGIQLYTGNFLQDCPTPGKGGVPMQKYGGFALETQHYPCSPSHPEFPTTVLRAGKVFRATTTLRFFTGKQCGKL